MMKLRVFGQRAVFQQLATNINISHQTQGPELRQPSHSVACDTLLALEGSLDSFKPHRGLAMSFLLVSDHKKAGKENCKAASLP